LTPKRRKQQVENDDYAAFVRRVLRAYARRVAKGDIDAIAGMVAVSRELDTLIGEAVDGLRAKGYSLADIGRRLGVSRQAVHERWGRREKPQER
jgi:DNA invertase Pin-like site-specific DNA recombinase